MPTNAFPPSFDLVTVAKEPDFQFCSWIQGSFLCLCFQNTGSARGVLIVFFKRHHPHHQFSGLLAVLSEGGHSTRKENP